MKIWFTFLVAATCTFIIGSAEYHRYKPRGPPRPPPPPPYMKKWTQNPSRISGPVRSRPIPLHVPQSHKKVLNLQQKPAPRPLAPPVRNFWKNPQPPTFQALVVEKPNKEVVENHLPNKFNGNLQEYDFHLQTNSIPLGINTIKQIGEKGPIHTIPAPNLSLADKPAVIEEVKKETRLPQQIYTTAQPLHQYQVTEATDLQQKLFNQQQTYYSHGLDAGPQVQTQIVHAQQSQHPYKFVQAQIDPKELYQLLNNQQKQYASLQQQQQQYLNGQPTYQYPNTQQSAVVESYAIIQTPQVHQQYIQQSTQQVPNYQTLLAQQQQQQQQSHLFQPEHNYIQSPQQNVAQSALDKVSVHPEYHSFNYEEPYTKTKTLPKKDTSSLVTAAYNLEPSAEASDIYASQYRSSMDELAKSQYVQNYFATADDTSAKANNVEPDAKPSNIEEEFEEDTDSVPELYSSLPNKEAADALASLQAAGKINSNIQQTNGHNKPAMTIYVPDENDQLQRSSLQSSKEEDYDDYSQEDMIVDESHPSDNSFGHRLNPKKH